MPASRSRGPGCSGFRRRVRTPARTAQTDGLQCRPPQPQRLSKIRAGMVRPQRHAGLRRNVRQMVGAVLRRRRGFRAALAARHGPLAPARPQPSVGGRLECRQRGSADPQFEGPQFRHRAGRDRFHAGCAPVDADVRPCALLRSDAPGDHGAVPDALQRHPCRG